MKKILLKISVFVFIFLLTGCSSEYNLIVSNKKIKENIKVDILDTDIPKAVPGIDVELNDRVTPFIENDQYPFSNNDKIKYNKKVKKNGDLTTVTLDYTYANHDEFKKSTTFSSCFEKAELKKTRKGFDLNLSGSFYCLVGDSVNINIKTNNEVLFNNADKVSGNTYTWVINNDNVKDTKITISFSKNSALVKPLLYLILGALLLIGSIFAYRFYSKYKDKDSVNDL